MPEEVGHQMQTCFFGRQCCLPKAVIRPGLVRAGACSVIPNTSVISSESSGAIAMADKFRVGLSGDFRNADGSPTFRDFDLTPLLSDAGVEVSFLESETVLSSSQLEDIDALILLAN